jgi:hypothetical protein
MKNNERSVWGKMPKAVSFKKHLLYGANGGMFLLGLPAVAQALDTP